MAQIFKGRVYSSTPYPSAEINYEYTRDGANMKYRFTGRVYLESSGGWYYNNLQLKLYLNSSNVYTKDCKSSNKGWSIDFDSGWKTVENKTSGTTPFYFTVKDTQDSSWCNYTSSTYNLTVAPAYFSSTPTIKIVSKTETTATIEWTTPETCSKVQYKINNGSWVDVVEDANAKSGKYTINTGLSAGETYTIYGDYKRRDSGLWSQTKPSAELTTYKYPYCNSAPNFTLGGKLTLGFYNPLKRTLLINMLGADGSTCSQDTITGTTIGDTWTAEVHNSFYNSIPNAQSGTYKVRLRCSELNRDTTVTGGTYSIVGNETPTFSKFTYKDTNTTVTGVTGNDQILVQGQSTLQVTISSANKMVAKKGASPKNYAISIDSLKKTLDYSTGDISSNVGTVSSSGTKRLNITAYDTRKLYTTAYKDITVYAYSKPTINASITRLNNFEAQTTLKVSGTYTRLNISGADKNTLNIVQYKYREAGGTWSDWINLNTTVTSGKFTCSDVILSLDNTKSYEFQIRAIDKLQTTVTARTVDIGQAVFFVSSNKKACYINGQQIIMYDVVDEW